MGDRQLLTKLDWSVEYELALKKLHVIEDDEEDFREIYDKTVQLIQPVAYIGKEDIVSNDGHTITIGNVGFTSRVVCVNLQNNRTVYPYVCTSGRAAYEYACSLRNDPLFEYWANMLCEFALRSYMVSFNAFVRKYMNSEKIRSLNPGSVIDWPISQQVPLFELLGGVTEKTGIFLEKSFLMRPVKSSSGIFYSSQKHFTSCSLCSMQNCPNRRAAFDPEKFRQEYGE